jgi:hypothetical protein
MLLLYYCNHLLESKMINLLKSPDLKEIDILNTGLNFVTVNMFYVTGDLQIYQI